MISPKPSDKTRPADLVQHGKGTGPVRTQRPVYQDLLPHATMPVRRAKISRHGSPSSKPVTTNGLGKR